MTYNLSIYTGLAFRKFVPASNLPNHLPKKKKDHGSTPNSNIINLKSSLYMLNVCNLKEKKKQKQSEKREEIITKEVDLQNSNKIS